MSTEKQRSTRPTRRFYHWLVLGLGIMFTSTASVLIRSAEAPSLAVGAWRMFLASLVLAPFALRPALRELPGLTRRERWLLVLSGVCLALHFATWIASLSYTSVASSVILVSTNPIWVALIMRFVFKQRVHPLMGVAIAIAMVGTIVISYGDLTLSPLALWGDVLAVLGAVFGSMYIMLGRRVRARLSTLAYVWPCYGVAAGCLVVLCLVGGVPLFGYDLRTMAFLLAIAVGPQVLGHSSYNWALGYFSPIFVTIALLTEPIGAVLLAWLVLGEGIGLGALIGGPLILFGIYLASRQEVLANGDEAF